MIFQPSSVRLCTNYYLPWYRNWKKDCSRFEICVRLDMGFCGQLIWYLSEVTQIILSNLPLSACLLTSWWFGNDFWILRSKYFKISFRVPRVTSSKYYFSASENLVKIVFSTWIVTLALEEHSCRDKWVLILNSNHVT